MGKPIDLDEVMLSSAAGDAWQVLCNRLVVALEALRLVGRIIDASSVPDEQARIEDDGTLTIHVDIPDLMEVSLTVPVGQWTKRL
jgi:hypothetical protein